MRTTDTSRTNAAHDPTAPEKLYWEAQEMEREVVILKRIVRKAYLYMLDQAGHSDSPRLAREEQVELGRDLAAYGCSGSNVRKAEDVLS